MSIQAVTLPEFNTNIDDLFSRMDPELPTSLEKEYASNMSDIEFPIFRHKLATVATEGKEVMAKLGVSWALRSEGSGAGIYTACGDISSAAAGVYYHALSGQLPIKYTLSKGGREKSVRIEDGDIFFSTDPVYGASHTHDQIAFMPVVVDGTLVTWVSGSPTRRTSVPWNLGYLRAQLMRGATECGSCRKKSGPIFHYVRIWLHLSAT